MQANVPEPTAAGVAVRVDLRALTGIATERCSRIMRTSCLTDAAGLTADELEQLAQSLAVDGSLGRADTLRVVEALRALAAARRASRP